MSRPIRVLVADDERNLRELMVRELARRGHEVDGVADGVLALGTNGEGPSLPSGKKSLTLRLTFSLPDRTLRDEEVQASVDRILASLKERCGAQLRG